MDKFIVTVATDLPQETAEKYMKRVQEAVEVWYNDPNKPALVIPNGVFVERIESFDNGSGV